jgi:Ca-activated chloride channel family protein
MKNLKFIPALITIFFFFYFSCSTFKRKEEAKLKQNSPAEQYTTIDKMSETEDLKGVKTVEENPVNPNTEEYDHITENSFKNVIQNPLSTFSIDVDNASYSNVRRFLNNNQMPDRNAVRIEEMINYFDYEYPNPVGKTPFSFVTEVSECPWNQAHQLIHIGIHGKEMDLKDVRPSNLVFLLDVSGSMDEPNKLPLLKKAFSMLVDQLDDRDKISIVVYAGSAGLILSPTSASKKDAIKDALNNLHAEGSTAGGEGIELAYKIAKDAFIADGNNRVILATDGDFNVGVSSTGALVDLIQKRRDDDIFLTILGFGMGNYKDGRMEQIADAGNGNYFYIDNIQEAQKVFVKNMRANMFTIAKDVKIQIEFNPAKVKEYRLIGYENRMLNAEDFENDKKDAGELGPGHTVTALYEIVPAGSDENNSGQTKLKYQEYKVNNSAQSGNELMTLKFRYKQPKEDKSILVETPILDEHKSLDQTSENFRFAAAVAGFGMILRDSEFKGKADYDMVENLAESAKGKDADGYRTEFVKLVKTAELLSKN